MSDFACEVVSIDSIEPIEGADRIEVAYIGDYQVIVGKDSYKVGDFAVYIPEQSIVPVEVQKTIGVEGRLSGKGKDRVKAIKLKGVLSQGLLYPLNPQTDVEGTMKLGWDMSDALGITKYEPPIPTQFQGKHKGGYLDVTINYDFENIKKTPDMFEEDEDVVFTEKLHGTFMCIGIMPLRTEPNWFCDGRIFVTSKGLSKRGITIDDCEDNRQSNTYVKILLELFDTLPVWKEKLNNMAVEPDAMTHYILGEVYGAGIQDLAYGTKKPEFRVFDIYAGLPNKGEYLNHDDLMEACNAVGFETVPVLYKGKFNKDTMLEFTNGPSTLADHIKEGIVIKSLTEGERYGKNRMRKIAKSISEDYLLRKGGSEFN